MNTILPKSHPTFFKCLNGLKIQERSTDIDCAQAEKNKPPPKNRRKSVDRRSQDLLDILKTWVYMVTDDDKVKYVRSIAHLYKLGGHKAGKRENV